MNIASRVHALQQTIRHLEEKNHRVPGSVRLMAVSKTRTAAEMHEAIQAGVHDFGENYYQEALPKIQELTFCNLCWHFIGPIQRNKTRGIATHFSWVHSLCRIDIAQRLNDARAPIASPLNVCIQVNLDNEPTKAGLPHDEVLDFARTLLTLPKLCLRGLMIIPEPTLDKAARLTTFLRLTHLLEQINQTLHLQLDTLSMGMSDDLDDAIRAGSTMVRIGRGLFGERPTQ